MIMEILKKEKNNPWIKRLLAIGVGEKVAIEFKSRATVRSIISDRVVNDFPEIELTTQKAEMEIGGKKVKYLEVERLR